MLKNSLKTIYKDHYENQYLQLIRDIINEGSLELGRNGILLLLLGLQCIFL